MDGNGDDPFDSLTKLCIVSDSQEDILRRCSFAGDPKSIDASDFSASQILHLHPSHVSMPSPPESLEQREQITSRDAYQPPPEQSGRQRPMAVDDPSLQDTAAAVEGGCVRDVARGVDLGKNNDLGFRFEVQSKQQSAEIEIIGVCRRKVSESDADGEAESALKRLKLSNEALGTVEKLLVDLEFGKESKLIDESVRFGEESGKIDDGKISNGEETHCNKNKEKFAEKKTGNSQPEEPSYLGALNRDPWRHVVPLTTNGSNSKKTDDATSPGDSGTPTSIIMKILKILSQEESEEDKKLGNMSFLEIALHRGMTFPWPCWWTEGEDFSSKKNS